MGIGGHVLFLLVDRLPLLRTGRASHQLIVIVEQEAEEILRPLGGGVDPRAFEAAGDRVRAHPGFEAARPAEPHQRDVAGLRSEEQTSELQSLMRISYAVFCLKKKKIDNTALNN